MNPSHKIADRLKLLVGVLALVLLVAAAFSVVTVLSKTRAALDAVYTEQTSPLRLLDGMTQAQTRIRLSIAQAMLETRPERVANHLLELEANAAVIKATWDGYMSSSLSPQQADVAREFAVHQQRFLQDGIQASAAALRSGKLKAARSLATGTLPALAAPMEHSLRRLTELHVDGTQQAHAEAVVRVTRLRNQALGAIGAGVAVVLLATALLVSSIQRWVSRLAQGSAAQATTPASADATAVATETPATDAPAEPASDATPATDTASATADNAAWDGTERRGPDRAKNVTRPPFRSDRSSTPAAETARKTGTTDAS
jgi:hypothetical protein